METYVIRRLAAAAGLAAAVVTVVFLLLRLVPGDLVLVMLRENEAPPDKVVAMRHALGLDRPSIVQYASWWSGSLRGDFGRSFLSGRPIGTDLSARAPRSLELTGAALLLGVAVGVPLGALATRRPGGALDLLAGGVAILVSSRLWSGGSRFSCLGSCSTGFPRPGTWISATTRWDTCGSSACRRRPWRWRSSRSRCA